MTSQAASQRQTTSFVTVLIVLGHDTLGLQAILRHSNWDVQTATDFEHAALMMRSAPPSVVIAPHRVSGEIRWPRLLDVLRSASVPPRLIVTDQHTDDALWAEALSLGADDVLAQPFDPVEVFRAISAAWNASRRGSHGSLY